MTFFANLFLGPRQMSSFKGFLKMKKVNVKKPEEVISHSLPNPKCQQKEW